uniref:Uncharacterized protein n=1 Tax=viral metagenome TaxID=1070528 RepID=A0A6C0EFF0_9ZZZZ
MPYDSQEEQSEQNEHFMKEHDMVFSRLEDGSIVGGGFTIDSMLLKNITQYGGSPIEKLETMIGGNKQNEHMAVPFGLFYKKEKNIHKKFNNSSAVDMDMDNNNEISDEIYEELLKKVNANDDSYEKLKKSSNKSEKKKSRKNKIKLAKLSNNHKKTAKSVHT